MILATSDIVASCSWCSGDESADGWMNTSDFLGVARVGALSSRWANRDRFSKVLLWVERNCSYFTSSEVGQVSIHYRQCFRQQSQTETWLVGRCSNVIILGISRIDLLICTLDFALVLGNVNKPLIHPIITNVLSSGVIPYTLVMCNRIWFIAWRNAVASSYNIKFG